MLPLSVARLLRRAGQDGRRFGQTLLGKPDVTYAEREVDRDAFTETTMALLRLQIDRDLTSVHGGKRTVVSRYHVRLQALDWDVDDELST